LQINRSIGFRQSVCRRARVTAFFVDKPSEPVNSAAEQSKKFDPVIDGEAERRDYSAECAGKGGPGDQMTASSEQSAVCSKDGGAAHGKNVAARTDQTNYMATRTYKELEAAARQLGVKLQMAWAPDPATIDSAFLAMTKERAQALFVIPSSAYLQHRELIIKHVAKNRLPAIYFQPIFVENGGLMSYGPDFADEFHRLAIYVDKILKGVKPADLPVEQPTKFELVINSESGKADSVNNSSEHFS
jgi:hypothetical protein